MGLGRLELPTSRLSSARSNQLSYKPELLKLLAPPSSEDPRLVLGLEERETKTAAPRQRRPDWPLILSIPVARSERSPVEGYP